MPDSDGPRSLPPELVEDFLAVLDDTDSWERDAASWTAIDQVVQRARAAALAGDAAAFQDATTELDLLGGGRGNDAGSGAKGKPSAEQRGSTAELKHTLTAAQQTGAGKSSGDSRKGR
ncbi:CATRA system-associated protein [Actinoplanes auranticolor]|uniref:CATRA-Associated Small Protein domain-containing protein n=1 Tax=Actinoplanes auranticolor TaxID=47988 RepID=A0A919S9T0_9ACTN|nr:CATRA system-associated protein [Actinoplanes auranticolor]GIM66956.1 hypothetical protein Aau02nite_25280 [Actinoplanes auranticolor]